jgi:hypothetical protein
MQRTPEGKLVPLCRSGAGHLMPGQPLPVGDHDNSTCRYDPFIPEARAALWKSVNDTLVAAGVHMFWLDGDEIIGEDPYVKMVFLSHLYIQTEEKLRNECHFPTFILKLIALYINFTKTGSGQTYVERSTHNRPFSSQVGDAHRSARPADMGRRSCSRQPLRHCG